MKDNVVSNMDMEYNEYIANLKRAHSKVMKRSQSEGVAASQSFLCDLTFDNLNSKLCNLTVSRRYFID